jgi:hypothetical protein
MTEPIDQIKEDIAALERLLAEVNKHRGWHNGVIEAATQAEDAIERAITALKEKEAE